MTELQYMRMALEKEAGIGQTIAKQAPKIWAGLKGFAKKPISTTMKKLFWTRAKPGTIGKNVASEVGYGVKWGGGLGVAGIAASPLFTSRNI